MASLSTSPVVDVSARRLGLGGSDLVGSTPYLTSGSLGNTSVVVETDVGSVQWNLLREQISNLSREMNAMRQDITTLRLADSQYEVQNAETSRHVREMQAQIRSDLQNEVARVEKLELNYSAAVVEAQKATKCMNDIQERLIKDVSIVDDRVSKFWGVCEERFAIINKVQVRLDELKVEAKLNMLQNTLSKAIQDVSEALRVELTALKDKPSMDDVKKVCNTLLQDLVSKQAAQEKLSKEAKEDLAKFVVEHKSNTDSIHKTIRDLISQERSAREKMHGTAHDRLQDLERRHRDALADLASHKDKASVTSIETLERKIQEVSRLHDDKFDNLKGLHGHVNTACESLDAKVMAEIRRLSDDHRRLGEEQGKKHQTLQDMLSKLQTEHQSKHLDTHTTLADMVQALEKRMREAIATHVSESDSKHSGHAGSLEAMQRRWKEDLATLTSEHHGHHAEHKEQLGKFSRDMYKELSEIREAHARQSSSHKSLVDELNAEIRALIQDADCKLRREMASLCDELRSQLIEFITKEKQDREAQCGSLGGRLEDTDRRLKDMLVRIASEQENTYSTLSGMLGVLERKLREELHGVHDDSHGKTADLKDQLQRGLSDTGTRHTELKELISRVQAEEKRAREDHSKGLGMTLEQLELKLRREITSGTERHQSNIREHVTQERQLREKAHSMLMERFAEFERKLAGEYSHAALRDISMEMREFVTNTCSRERLQMQDLLQKEQECRSSQLEAFSKVLLQERAAREAQQESLRVYLTNDKMARQSKDKSLLSEVDVQIQRVFREVRNHTHDVQALTAQQPSHMTAPTRSVSPMPRRAAPQVQQVQPQAVVKPTTVVTAGTVPATQVTAVGTGTMAVGTGTMAVSGVDVNRDYRYNVGSEDMISMSAETGRTEAFVDANRDYRTNYFVIGEDRNRDGIPDVLQGSISSPTMAKSYFRSVSGQQVQAGETPIGARGSSFVAEVDSPMMSGSGKFWAPC